jgi:hypothetical protein
VTVTRSGAKASVGGSPDQGLEHTAVHQTLHGLLLRDRSEMGVSFSLPSRNGGWRGEWATAASFTRTRPMAWGSSGDPLT